LSTDRILKFNVGFQAANDIIPLDCLAMKDTELVRQNSERNSEDVFETMVRKYTNLVYSAAYRQSGDPHTAEDITQAVFLILIRKPAQFAHDAFISSWLLRTTRYVALNARRKEMRRRNVEQQAMSEQPSETDDVWKRIAPILDEALLKLGEKDRNAVVMRFFDQRSFKEIALMMGSTEDGAQKRVSRALEKLRSGFVKRGIVVTAGIATAAISSHAVQPAPTSLAGDIAKRGAQGATASGLVATLRVLRLRRFLLRGGTVAAVAVVVAVWLVADRLNLGSASRPAAVYGSTRLQAELQPSGTAQAIEPGAAPPKREMLYFHVVDSITENPISKARVSVIWTTNYPHSVTNVLTADRDGLTTLPVYRAVSREWKVLIEVYRDGYVPKYVSWSEQQGDDPQSIPAEYTTKLSPAVKIGGTVVNESGEPIPDARVVFDVFGYDAPARLLDRERLTMNSRYHVEYTDSLGRWNCRHVPSEFGRILFQVAHPEYASTTFGSAALGPSTNHGIRYLPEVEFRNETAQMILKQGDIAAGVVIDEEGNPVIGAKVTLDHQFAEPTASQFTGPDGRFQFSNISPSADQPSPDHICSLTVQAELIGSADFTFKGTTPPKEFRLTVSKGIELRGRVLDDKDQPVSGATVEICSHSNVKRFEWSKATDPEGRFVWLTAPARPEYYIVQAPGYQPLGEVKWAADGTEHVVILHPNPPPVRIGGSVFDASTKKPIETFQVWMSSVEKRYTGYAQPMSAPRLPHLCAVGAAGQYAFTNKDPFISYELEVRADGYFPGKRSGSGALTNDCQFDFQLEQATYLKGEVRLAEGTPAASATVMLVTDRQGVYMKLPGQFDLQLSGAKHVETDAQGRFSFEPTVSSKNVIAFGSGGFASITPNELLASSVITLKPWGRVAGQLKIGILPGANQVIDLSLASMGKPTGYAVFLETKTDNEGRFLFEGVPPWFLNVAHRLSFRDGQPGPIPQTQQTAVQVSSGQTSHVTLGGAGYKVTGKVVLSDSASKVDWQSDVQTLSPKSTREPLPPGASQAIWSKWLNEESAYWESEAGRKVRLSQHRYTLSFSPDGSFTIDDVLPGAYQLTLRLSDLTKPISGPVGFHQPMATLTKEFIIPELPDGATLGSHDLGVIELKAISK
jgi:RNA polymerase sigma factor (sigma-70 family)